MVDCPLELPPSPQLDPQVPAPPLHAASPAAALVSRVLWATILIAGTGCTDLRDFRGDWSGERVGDAAAVRVGFSSSVQATLRIERADSSSLQAHFTTSDDVFMDALIQPIPGSEADVLGTMSFDGSPVRVYTAFVQTTDGGGDALAIVALYPAERVEVRILRGGTAPLYGIFALERRNLAARTGISYTWPP